MGLIVVASVMVLIAFKDKADWSGLLLNLATELFGAVVILILVERRLRITEVNAIRDIPRKSSLLFGLLFSWRKRQYYRYSKALLGVLSKRLESALPRHELDYLKEKMKTGFVLLGNAGIGKTVWLQFAASDIAKQYLSDPKQGSVPILFPLRRWLSDRTLEEAVFEHLNSFSSITQGSFKHGLSTGKFILMLDGADEVFMDEKRSLSNELSKLRNKFPKLTCIISSRPHIPFPANDLETVNLTPPTEEEIHEIQRRLGLR